MYPNVNGDYFGNAFEPMPPLLRDRWICVEVMVRLNDPTGSGNGELAYWIDGTLVLHLGAGFPHLRRRDGLWTADAGGTPFPGFQWRTTTALDLNFVLLQNYVEEFSSRGTLRFDHVVFARRYVGPLGGGGSAPPPAPAPTPPVGGTAPPAPPDSGGGSYRLVPDRCSCGGQASGLPPAGAALAALLLALARRRR
jgi:uncharacterized protein (TIGR03382 family)